MVTWRYQRLDKYRMVPPFFIFITMGFIKNIDLNKVCRILDFVAIIAFILGIVASLVLGIHKVERGWHDETIIDWTIIISGICVSFFNCLFLLFLSRIGDAVDDIRNKYIS